MGTTWSVAGSMRDTTPAALSPAQIAPAPAVIESGYAPSLIVVVRPDAGSMRDTVLSSSLATHAEPKSNATALGWSPTSYVATTFPSVASISARRSTPPPERDAEGDGGAAAAAWECRTNS